LKEAFPCAHCFASLTRPSETSEAPGQFGPSLSVEGIDVHQLAPVHEGLPIVVVMPFDQLREERNVEPSHLLPLSHEPGLKTHELVEIEALQKLAPKEKRKFLEFFCTNG
jgi:hypothetical protein